MNAGRSNWRRFGGETGAEKADVPGAWDFPVRHRGPCGPHGHGPHGHPFGRFGQRARRGLIRSAVLTLLTERPMHGYEIMQQLEERSGGHWRPSPGSVYPTLQMLEDEGLVKSEEVEGKRVFSLTDQGKAEAETMAGEEGAAPWAHEGPADPRHKLRHAVFQLGGAAKQIGIAGSDAQVEEALAILAEARKRLYTLLAEGD